MGRRPAAGSDATAGDPIRTAGRRWGSSRWSARPPRTPGSPSVSVARQPEQRVEARPGARRAGRGPGPGATGGGSPRRARGGGARRGRPAVARQEAATSSVASSSSRITSRSAIATPARPRSCSSVLSGPLAASQGVQSTSRTRAAGDRGAEVGHVPGRVAPPRRRPDMLARVETLSQRDLNRALLARQGLLEPLSAPLPRRARRRMRASRRSTRPRCTSALWSRLARLERDELTRALEAPRGRAGDAAARRPSTSSRPATTGPSRWPSASDAADLVVRGRCGPRRLREGEMERAAERLRAELAGRRDAAPGGDRGAAGQARRARDRALGRPRARAAVGDVGAAPRGPLRAGRGLDRPAGRRRRPGRAPRRALPARVRAGVAQGRGELHGPQAGRAQARARRARAACASRPRTATSCSTCRTALLPGRRRRGARPVPADLGRGAARARAADGGAARALPAAVSSTCACRSPCRRSSSTARSRGRGGGSTARSCSSRSSRCRRGVREEVEAAAVPLAAFHA